MRGSVRYGEIGKASALGAIRELEPKGLAIMQSKPFEGVRNSDARLKIAGGLGSIVPQGKM
jgi:hypothetical protein